MYHNSVYTFYTVRSISQMKAAVDGCKGLTWLHFPGSHCNECYLSSMCLLLLKWGTTALVLKHSLEWSWGIEDYTYSKKLVLIRKSPRVREKNNINFPKKQATRLYCYTDHEWEASSSVRFEWHFFPQRPSQACHCAVWINPANLKLHIWLTSEHTHYYRCNFSSPCGELRPVRWKKSAHESVNKKSKVFSVSKIVFHLLLCGIHWFVLRIVLVCTHLDVSFEISPKYNCNNTSMWPILTELLINSSFQHFSKNMFFFFTFYKTCTYFQCPALILP